MDEAFSEIRRALVEIVLSIKQSVDRRSEVINAEYFDELQSITMKLEGLRYILNQLRQSGRNRKRTFEEQRLLSDRLIREAISLQASLEFSELVGGARFRIQSQPARTRLYIPDITDNPEATVADALRAFIQMAKDVTKPDLVDEMEKIKRWNASELRRIVPSQKIAPVQFEIADGRLQIAHQDAQSRVRDEANILSARTGLIESGERLISTLRQSNCDPRLLETVEALQNKLVDQNDIIQLGIMNIGCDVVCKQFATELPDAIFGLLRAQTTGVGLYVAQFPQWAQFSENAALVEFSTNDINNISNATLKLISKLLDTPQAVDPEVPKTIEMLHALMINPLSTSKRAVFALMRTIENLVSKVFSYGISFLDDAATATSKKAAKAVSTVVVISLLSMAVQGATDLSSVVGKLGDTAWMSNAAKIVGEQIANTKIELN